MRNYLRSFIACITVALAIPVCAYAQDAKTDSQAVAAVDFANLPEPMAFAKAQYDEALRLNALQPSASRDDKIRAFARNLINYDEYAERSMGDRWKNIDAEKQAEFKSLFKE